MASEPAITFRRLEEGDLEPLLSWIPSADALFQWSGPWDFIWPLTREQLLADLESASERRRVLAAVGDGGRELLGHVMLTIWPSHGFAVIGRVLVDPARRGAGLGTALMREIVRVGFDELGLHRLQLTVYEFNATAIACYQQSGFVIEGRLRESTKASGGYWNAYVMGLLDEDYRAQREAPPGGLVIRPARFADADALTHLLAELGYPQDVSDTRANLVGWAGDPRSLLLLAEIHGLAAGFIAAHAIPTLERPGGFVRVVALSIDSAHRREGLGRRLLAAVEAWAADLGCGGIELTSRRTRDGAQAFYRALGFEDACGRSALLRRSIA